MSVADNHRPFVRQVLLGPLPAPAAMHGGARRLFGNLLGTPGNAILTVIGSVLLVAVAVPVIQFLVVDAVWSGASREDCLAANLGREVGACWPFIWAKLGQLMYGFYPQDERWRVDLTYLLAVALIVPLLIPRAPLKGLNALLFFVVFPIVAYIFLVGGAFGLPFVDTRQWGGFLVTLVVAVSGIVISLPLGIVLALGRRSDLPIVHTLSVAFIEFWRGVPMVTVLFFAVYMLPLFIPGQWNVDVLLRAMVGVALFSAAYMAEVVRGGLQAIPGGQYEAARALGLGYWRMYGLVVLPQALRHVIPGIVNTFIGLFKDTTLVLIVAIFDLLGQLRAAFADPNWATPSTLFTGFAFVGVIYFIFCFGMSRYSMFVERRLDRGARG